MTEGSIFLIDDSSHLGNITLTNKLMWNGYY